jgi:hypothetical protein
VPLLMTDKTRSTDRLDALLDVIRAEYREMPGLCLTFPQVLRLWTLDPPTGRALVTRLVDAQFLRATPDGQYVRFDLRRTVDRRRERPPARFGARRSAASHSTATG